MPVIFGLCQPPSLVVIRHSSNAPLSRNSQANKLPNLLRIYREDCYRRKYNYRILHYILSELQEILSY